ncbi:MAG: AmmeMemoRadiSam system protein A [Desulfosalsimonadaceae bacterium]
MNTNSSDSLPGEKGELLLALARKTIAERLGLAYEGLPGLEDKLTDKAFDDRRGTFVTLKRGGQLRGCIGNLAPENPIRHGIAENAVNAAFNDPRFAPLRREEFDSIQLEISLLTEPALLDYNGPEDLLAKLTPGEDGVIIRKGMHSATFLPQVWDQLPDKEAFLSHLCLKAGLAADEWKRGDLLVYTYRVQYFEENP